MKNHASSSGTLIGLVVMMMLASAASAGAGERAVKAAAVPAAVREAVKKKYPDARVLGYAREEESGNVTYEVSVRAKGRVTDVSVAPEGRVLIEEERIASVELPPAVAKAFAASAHGRGHVKRIERIVEAENGDAPRFEILVKDGGAFIELTFDSDGRIIKQERTQKAD